MWWSLPPVVEFFSLLFLPFHSSPLSHTNRSLLLASLFSVFLSFSRARVHGAQRQRCRCELGAHQALDRGCGERRQRRQQSRGRRAGQRRRRFDGIVVGVEEEETEAAQTVALPALCAAGALRLVPYHHSQGPRRLLSGRRSAVRCRRRRPARGDALGRRGIGAIRQRRPL